jgi:Domain of unknown function (DUF4387)
MMRLQDIAQVIRSKNAGPRMLTLDIMFAAEPDYRRVLASGVLNPARIAALYGIEAQQVAVIDYPPARAIKITMPRRLTSGDPGDRDVYGAQQHTPLLGLEV